MARSQVRGAKALVDTFARLPKSLTPTVVRKAHQAALEPIQGAARANFSANGSYKTGVVPRDIQIVHGTDSVSRLGMVGMGASLGFLIEKGTAAHEQPNRGTWHPGSEPKPFMAPAFDSQEENAYRQAGGEYMRVLAAAARAK